MNIFSLIEFSNIDKRFNARFLSTEHVRVNLPQSNVVVHDNINVDQVFDITLTSKTIQ